MSTEDTQTQNRFGRIERSTNNEYVTREELQLKLELKELNLVELRRRVAELEGSTIAEETNDTPTVEERKETIRDQLAAIRGDGDE